MSRQGLPVLLGLAVLGVLAAGPTALAQRPKASAKAAKPEVSFKGKLVLVQTKSQAVVLENARLRPLGDRSFVVGKAIQDNVVTKAPFPGATIWLPVADVLQVAEFDSLDHLRQSLGRTEGRRFSPVDLQDKFTHKLSEKFGNDDRQGNFLTVPQGEQTLGGIAFKVGDAVIQLGSKVWHEKPEKAEAIRVNKPLTRLHILHATGYGGGPNAPGGAWFVEDDTLIGEYRVHYEDKTSETIPIVYGKDVRDWWSREDEPAPSRSKVAWTGDNELAKQYDCRLRLYLTTWENPHPEKRVISIDYLSRKEETAAAPFCVAMTVEEK
jgi:hypothetical protein